MIEGGSVLDGLPDDVRRALAARLQPRSLQGGEVLMREGDEADGLYLVQAGRLRALIGDGQDRRVLRDIGRGEVVGEAALLTDQPRSATVIALRDSELLYLSIQSFEEVVAENPSFLRAVSAQVVRRMLATQSGPVPSRPITTAAVVPLHATPLADDGATALAARAGRRRRPHGGGSFAGPTSWRQRPVGAGAGVGERSGRVPRGGRRRRSDRRLPASSRRRGVGGGRRPAPRPDRR